MLGKSNNIKAFIVSVTGRSKDLFSIMEYCNILKTVLTEKNGHLMLGVRARLHKTFLR